MPEQYTEQWLCGHCPFLVEIPDEMTNPDGYHDTIALIRDHRFAHIASKLMEADDEAILKPVEDKPTEPWSEQGDWLPPPTRPVTTDDVAPALAEADRIVRGG